MLKYLTGNNHRLYWIVFHSILGAFSILTPWLLIIWFYFVLLTSIPLFLKKSEDHFFKFTSLIVYVVSFELLSRMSKAYPLIPWEMGKYLLFLLLTAGILMKYRRGTVGWILLVLLLPSLFIDESDQVWFKNIIFNLLGPVNVALAVVYFKNQIVSAEEFISLLRLFALPAISVLTFVVIKAPNLEHIEFTLGTNFETAGDFGSNQVSTILGLGVFLAYLFWRNRWNLSGYRWLDFGLLILFTIRGLLTFSRGGMIGGALGIIIFLLLDREMTGDRRKIKPLKSILTAIPIIIILAVTFTYANKVSGGLLSKRYQGETPGTLAGRKEKTLNVFTSNRLQIFKDDLELWKEHPILGVGVGASRYLRDKSEGFLSHIEISRLLSEHGALGLLYILILLKLGWDIIRNQNRMPHGAILATLYIVALFTTFHSAMRTYVSPLFFGLSMLTIIEEGHNELENES